MAKGARRLGKMHQCVTTDDQQVGSLTEHQPTHRGTNWLTCFPKHVGDPPEKLRLPYPLTEFDLSVKKPL